MMRAYIDALVDTLVPGDDTLPSGSAVGVSIALCRRLEPGPDRDPRLQAALEAIEARAGGAPAFCRANETARVEVLEQIERAMPESFGVVVSVALMEYYDADVVLERLGWRREPPQPGGHPLEPFDERRLEVVKRRAANWRSS